MASDKAIPAGDVVVTLVGEPVTLLCTLRAWRDVPARFGSYAEAYRRVAEFDGTACAAIIAAATNKPFAEVEESVFMTGLPDLVEPIKEYLAKLSNGGRKPSPPSQDKDAPKGEG